MCQNPALVGLKIHAQTPYSDAFPCTWSTCKRHGISYPDLIWKVLGGKLVAENGQQGPIVHFCRGLLFSQYPPNILPIFSQYSPTNSEAIIKEQRTQLGNKMVTCDW